MFVEDSDLALLSFEADRDADFEEDFGRLAEPVAPVEEVAFPPAFGAVLSSDLSESDSDSGASAIAVATVPKVKIQWALPVAELFEPDDSLHSAAI